LFHAVSARLKGIEVGVHLHSSPATTSNKITACYEAGCLRIDGALKGYGGCPMAEDDLVGNIATEEIVAFLQAKGVESGISEAELNRALLMASEIFPKH
jgi:hydroxymethylglutaryl-CoA lyase